MYLKIDLHKIFDLLLYDEKEPLLFNSGFFIWFFALFIIVYYTVSQSRNARITTLTLFSLYFFYKACGWFVGLILFSAIVDFFLSNLIYKTQSRLRKKTLLIFSVILNLGLLFFFKYTDFFIILVNNIGHNEISLLNLMLPIGISFYTFENLSYTIDVYKGEFKPVTRFMDYLYFLSFFPKLMMGPIVRASDFLPQLNQPYFVSREDFAKGFYLIFTGLFKKIVISDFITANLVNYIFDDPSKHVGLECLIAVYGYALVIYCDFSGYSDMAIGIARWCGIKIPQNFNSPYQSASITEFWRRWHISLSSWLRDYLYIPLGGSKKGKVRQYINLFITMLLGGFWHGASWNYIIWGGMHGTALTGDKIKVYFAGKLNFNINKKLKRMIGVLITFHFVCFCWIFFRSSSLSDSEAIIDQIANNFSASTWRVIAGNYGNVLWIMLLGFVLHAVPNKLEIKIQNKLSKLPMYTYLIIAIIFIFIFMQMKTAEPIMPVSLQF